MSYIYSNEMKYADSGNLDAFGRLRVSQTTTLLDVKHAYDKLPLFVDELVSAGATSSWAEACVTMSTTQSDAYAIRQTYKCAHYQSGKSQLVEASFTNFATQSNVIKRVGYYTSGTASSYNSGFDGFFLESNGVNNTISFQIWKGGTNIATATSSAWLDRDYDAALIDWTKTQLLFVDFQWLGVGRVRFHMVIEGTLRLFYEFSCMNNLPTVYMNIPHKPMRYEIRQSGAGSGSFGMMCSSVSMEGSINNLYKPVAINDFTERTLSVANTTYAVLGIRLSESNREIGVSGLLNFVDILQSSNDNYLVTVQKEPTIVGTPTWTQQPGTPIEYSFGEGALTVSADGFVIYSFMGKSGAITQEKMEMAESAHSLGYHIDGKSEDWWVCIRSTGATSKFRTGVNIKYYK